MQAVSLGKLLKKKAFVPIIRGLVNSLGGGILIEDAEGGLLLAVAGVEPTASYPVEAAGEIIGWAKGGSEVEPIAALLSFQAEREIERRSLVTETLHKYKEITLLYDLVEKVASCLDRQEVARVVIEQARRVIKLDHLSLRLLNRESGNLEILSVYGQEADDAMKEVIRPGEGIAGSVWASGQAEIINEVAADPRFVRENYKVGSMICAPLKTSEAVIGVACLSSEEPVVYTAEDLKLFTTLAYQAAVAIENAGLYEQLKDAFYTTVYTLAETIEKRDPYTGNHTKRVMEYSLAIGKTLGLEQKELTRLQLAAILHDVGKIGVRDNILLKEGRLTEEEFIGIKQHSIYGAEILAGITHLHNIIPGVKHHHERFDGRGYPDGLSGDNIDIIARIIAVADTFDAMITDRPYRKGLSIDVAFDELKNNAGSQFDPRMVEAFFATDIMDAYFSAASRSKILKK